MKVPHTRKAREGMLLEECNKLEERDVLGAFGCTFVLAPGFTARLGAEDSLLMSTFVKHHGLAIIMLSELSPKVPSATFSFDMEPFLSESASRVLVEDNAGGSSSISEALSMELLNRTFGAQVLKTEKELVYWPSNGAITDFSVSLDGVRLGVSVSRAMPAPDATFTQDDADLLLRKKLRGVIISTETCVNESWQKQILHIWAKSRRTLQLLEQAYQKLEPELVADTVVLITRCSLAEVYNENSSRRRRAVVRPLKGLKSSEHMRILRESDPLVRQLVDQL